jgi:hypothetical protein
MSSPPCTIPRECSDGGQAKHSRASRMQHLRYRHEQSKRKVMSRTRERGVIESITNSYQDSPTAPLSNNTLATRKSATEISSAMQKHVKAGAVWDKRMSDRSEGYLQVKGRVRKPKDKIARRERLVCLRTHSVCRRSCFTELYLPSKFLSFLLSSQQAQLFQAALRHHFAFDHHQQLLFNPSTWLTSSLRTPTTASSRSTPASTTAMSATEPSPTRTELPTSAARSIRPSWRN